MLLKKLKCGQVIEDSEYQWRKTKIICFSKKKKTPVVKIKLYEQKLEQVSEFRF